MLCLLGYLIPQGAMAYVSGGQIRLLSRAGRDMTGRYPELAVLARRVDVPVIVDGEIIAIRDGRPDFGWLQSRMHVRHPPGCLVREVPVQLYLFDLLDRGRAGWAGMVFTSVAGNTEPLPVRPSVLGHPGQFPGSDRPILWHHRWGEQL